MTKVAFEWTDKNVLLLKELWNKGCAARDIADRLGNDVTRNAVIGKANRLGLSAPKVAKIKNIKKSKVTSYPPETKCQWPFSDPDKDDFNFCEKDIEPSRPYCSDHCGEAYRRLSPAPTPARVPIAVSAPVN